MMIMLARKTQTNREKKTIKFVHSNQCHKLSPHIDQMVDIIRVGLASKRNPIGNCCCFGLFEMEAITYLANEY